MGKISPSSHLHKTMKIQVMCDRSREHLSSKLINGEGESIPIVSMAKAFENVEDLKSRLNENHEVQDSYDYPNTDQSCHSEAIVDNEIAHVRCHPSCEDEKLPDCNDEALNSGQGHSNGLTHSLKDLTLGSDKNTCDAQCTERVKPDTVLISTQDVTVDVSNSARFSKVLENFSLPLLYIPTTKQLIAQEQAKKESVSQSSNVEETSEPNVESIDANLSTNIDFNETHGLSSEISPSLYASNSLYSPTTDYPDVKSLGVLNQDIYPDYLRPCDTISSCHLFADDVSLSSVSTCTDFSVSAFSVSEDYNAENRSLSQSQVNEDSVFMDINLHSRNSFDRSQKVSTLENGEEVKASQTDLGIKKGFSSIRNIFGKKVKDENTPGWKLFGKIPPKVTTNRNAQEISSEYQAKHTKPVEKPQFPSNPNRKQVSEVMSTTALILEKRPQNLPTKSKEEEERHRQEYVQMIDGAKKKEQKDSKLRKKKLQQQRKYEDKLMSFARVWISDIIPNWEAMRQTKKVRDLWWLGLPPNVRGKVWMNAIGNDLNITHELYEICHKRAEDKIKLMVEAESNVSSPQEATVSSSKEDSVNVIKLDVSRTFPQLGIMQKGGPYHDLLHSLLGAYACYRPDVGYVQGMSFIAAILLLNMEVADAFVCFANMLNRPCQVAFFRMDENIMAAYYKTFEAFFKENLTKLHFHFVSHNVTPNLYLMEWVFLLYAKSLPLDVACRVWDVYCRDGEEFLFRTAIAILKLYESVLLKMDFIHIAQFLTKLPENIRGEDLFHELEGIRMSIDKRAFNAVHAFYKDLHESNS